MDALYIHHTLRLGDGKFALKLYPRNLGLMRIIAGMHSESMQSRFVSARPQSHKQSTLNDQISSLLKGGTSRAGGLIEFSFQTGINSELNNIKEVRPCGNVVPYLELYVNEFKSTNNVQNYDNIIKDCSNALQRLTTSFSLAVRESGAAAYVDRDLLVDLVTDERAFHRLISNVNRDDMIYMSVSQMRMHYLQAVRMFIHEHLIVSLNTFIQSVHPDGFSTLQDSDEFLELLDSINPGGITLATASLLSMFNRANDEESLSIWRCLMGKTNIHDLNLIPLKVWFDKPVVSTHIDSGSKSGMVTLLNDPSSYFVKIQASDLNTEIRSQPTNVLTSVIQFSNGCKVLIFKNPPQGKVEFPTIVHSIERCGNLKVLARKVENVNFQIHSVLKNLMPILGSLLSEMQAGNSGLSYSELESQHPYLLYADCVVSAFPQYTRFFSELKGFSSSTVFAEAVALQSDMTTRNLRESLFDSLILDLKME